MATSSSGSSGRPRLSASPAQSAATGKKPRATPAKPSSAQQTPATSQAGASTADLAKAKGKRPSHDWEAVERDHATGRYTDGELAAKHKVARESIVRRRAREQAKDPKRWQKDLTKQVQEATAALLIHEAVTKGVTDTITAGHTATAVLIAAEANAIIVRRHKAKLDELHAAAETAKAAVLKLLPTAADYREVTALTSAIESLSRTTKTLIDKEREAHGMKAGDDGDDKPTRTSLTVEFVDAPAHASD